MKSKFLFIAIVFVSFFSSCKKEAAWLPLPVVESATVTYKVYDLDSTEHPESIQRTISYMSGWEMKNDSVVPIIVDTVITGNFTLTFIEKTYKINNPQKADNYYNYYVMTGLGFRNVDCSVKKHSVDEIDINSSLRVKNSNSCGIIERTFQGGPTNVDQML